MKKYYTLLIAILLTLSANAQAPEQMSYQAVIRDASNALVTSQAIGMQISILKGSATGTAVYTETQTASTNTSGLVSLEIGTGTTSDDFSTINWANDTYFIKVETDPTGGANYAVTGTSQLLSVPYALYAKTAENVSGLEALDEGNGIGWRLKGQNPDYYGNIGENAVNFSYSEFGAAATGATGTSSTAMGEYTTASGIASTAMGSSASAFGDNSTAMGRYVTAEGNSSTAMGDITTAEGHYSTAMGFSTTAEGNNSTAMGNSTYASGESSTAMGTYTTAPSYGETALGTFNTTYTPTSTDSFSDTDRLLVVGNGDPSNAESDALIILKNGMITAPSLDISEITDNKALVTKEYADANFDKSSGLEAIYDGFSISWRLKGQYLPNHLPIGIGAIDLSIQTASSNIIGGASGEKSVAMGYSTTASGWYSMVMGRYSTASGGASTAMGYAVTAETYAQTSIGAYNTEITGNATDFVTTDRLFVIGNGTSSSAKSDAMVVLKNGNTTINGDLKVDEVNATDSGSADMKAYVYGLVGADGGASTVNTDGFTLSYIGVGHYNITFDVPMARTKYVAVATLHNGIGFINLIRQNDYIEVKTYNTAGTLADRGFYFVVYKK